MTEKQLENLITFDVKDEPSGKRVTAILAMYAQDMISTHEIEEAHCDVVEQSKNFLKIKIIEQLESALKN